MNNIKKLGVTALAGSLVAVSAQAGEMSMNGSANFTWAQKDGTEGKSIGTDKGLTVSGSGELDNGWTFSVGTYFSDTLAISTHVTTLTMGSMGTLKVGHAYGGIGSAYDEEVPQVYEQTSDAYQNSANLVGAYMDGNSVAWDLPAIDLGGMTAAIDLVFSPDATDSTVNNGGQGTHTGVWGLGYGAGVTITGLAEGLTLGVYGDLREDARNQAGDSPADQFTGTWYAKFSAGPVSFGYQSSYFDTGGTGSAVAVNSPATVGTSSGTWEAENMSIAFNVNDNLSISWTDTKDTYDNQSDNGTSAQDADTEKSTDAIQIAYSMGGMSIKAYRMEEKNPNYDADAVDSGKSEISLGLAF